MQNAHTMYIHQNNVTAGKASVMNRSENFFIVIIGTALMDLKVETVYLAVMIDSLTSLNALDYSDLAPH